MERGGNGCKDGREVVEGLGFSERATACEVSTLVLVFALRQFASCPHSIKLSSAGLSRNMNATRYTKEVAVNAPKSAAPKICAGIDS